MKRDHLAYFIDIEVLACHWVDSPFYVEYNDESFKHKINIDHKLSYDFFNFWNHQLKAH